MSILKTFYKNLFNNNLVWNHPLWHSTHKKINPILLFTKKRRKFLIVCFIAFLISDLLLIKSYHLLLPDKDSPLIKAYRPHTARKNLSSELYRNIWINNIFHRGPIPVQLQQETISLVPVLSTLPFQLKGTIIHSDPNHSVATIKAGSDHKTQSYMSGEIIEKQAEIREIHRRKVIFFNLNNNRLEFITIPEEKQPFKLSYLKKTPLPLQQNSIVRKTGLGNFEINRSDINDYLHNLPEILQQARVMPHPDGFEFTHIDKNSIFNKLGFKKGDIIKEVDGEIVKTPEQALELFDRLKGEDRVEILIQKDGKDIKHNYTIRNNAPTI